MGEKDPDGSLRVPGYRGVWVSKEGKHFIKIDGQRFKRSENDKDIEFFDSIDDAAKKHDEVIRKGMKSPKAEFNFKPDGSKIVYEDITPASTSGLGGSASNVVPALSVINIKVSVLLLLCLFQLLLRLIKFVWLGNRISLLT
jgi:galactokinase/mevalonate kinase-like predicted kinase